MSLEELTNKTTDQLRKIQHYYEQARYGRTINNDKLDKLEKAFYNNLIQLYNEGHGVRASNIFRAYGEIVRKTR